MIKGFYSLFCFSIVFEVFVSVVHAQENDNTKLPIIILPSPDASSLGKFGEVPVSKYTGVPQISIPIYTVTEKDITIPVSLSYHAGGIKVEEHAGWTGLGWALNAGGMITRTVMGLPDEAQGGYLNQSYDVNNIQSLGEQNIQTMVRSVNNRTLDIEPDNFLFNIPGISGKLIFDKVAQSWICSPKQSVKVTNTISNNAINSWEIIDGRGYIFKFQIKERSIIESFDGRNRSNSFYQVFNSSWYLTEIVSPTGNSIILIYQPYTNQYYTRQGATKYIFLGGGYYDNEGNIVSCSNMPNEVETYSENTIQGYRIESIQFSSGKIKFIKSTSTRLDMPNDYSLEAIEIQDMQNNVIKKQKLNYSYYESNAGSLGSDTYLYNQNFKKRLKLDKVQEVALAEVGAEYSFEYISGELPSVFSNSQDHWGFYNGASNSSLVPLDAVNGFGGAGTIKAVNFNSARIGTLQKLIYPTGGYSLFTYESNDAAIPEFQYFEHFYPYGPTSSQYLQQYSASVDYSSRTATIYIDAKTSNLDLSGNNFNYSVYLNRQSNCNGGDRDCIGNLEILIMCTDCGTSNGVGTNYSLTSGNFVNGVSNGTIKLIPGRNYLLQMSGTAASTQGASATISGSKEVLPVFGNNKINVQVGGLRIKNIEDYADLNISTFTTHYIYNNDINYEPGSAPIPESSGSIVSFPVYNYINDYLRFFQASPDMPVLFYQCFYKVMSANSRMPLAATGGSAVGYSHVQTFKTDGVQKIRSLSSFASPAEYPDIVSYDYPQAIERSYENMRGDILKEKHFSFIGNQFALISLTENTYDRPSQFVTYSPGLKIGITKFVPPTMGNNGYVLKPYHLASEWKFLSSTTSVTYDQNGTNPLTKQTTFSYENPAHLQLTKSEETSSGGKKIINAMVYPQDYQSGNSIVDQLISKNITDIPLETIRYQQANGNTNIISGSAILYKPGGTGLKDEVYSLQSSSPIDQTFFKFSNKSIGILPFASGSATPQTIDSRYGLSLKYDIYDNKGNVLQATGRDRVIKSYIWGYNQQYPVAEIIGKNYADAISQSGIDLTVVANPLSEASLQTELNKLRTVQGVIVKTYTYKPLIGISSETDSRGLTTYYIYDNLNRLSLIKDNNTNIIKKFCYNYKGQTTDYIQYGNQQLSQTFTRNNCGSGYAGGQVIYSVATNTYFASTQAASNALAQNDINTNGQAYANANGTCTPICTNCTANSQKCIYGFCETGFKICVSCYFDYSMWMFVNTFYYRWSDGSISQQYVEYDFYNCDGTQCW